MNLISAIDITASALTAEKFRSDIVAQNIANAHTTRDVNGAAYQRKIVSFETQLQKAGSGVQVSSVSDDARPGPVIYDPAHPDANESGMVQMPNVNVAMEMVDLMTSSRAYEANLAVIRNARQMAAKALTIGK